MPKATWIPVDDLAMLWGLSASDWRKQAKRKGAPVITNAAGALVVPSAWLERNLGPSRDALQQIRTGQATRVDPGHPWHAWLARLAANLPQDHPLRGHVHRIAMTRSFAVQVKACAAIAAKVDRQAHLKARREKAPAEMAGAR